MHRYNYQRKSFSTVADRTPLRIARHQHNHSFIHMSGLSKSTLAGRGLRRPWAIESHSNIGLEDKYERRGYLFVDFKHNNEAIEESADGSERFSCPHKVRSFADEGTLRLWYGETTDEARSEDDDLLKEVVWQWGGFLCMCCDQSADENIMIRKVAFFEVSIFIYDRTSKILARPFGVGRSV